MVESNLRKYVGTGFMETGEGRNCGCEGFFG